MMNSKNNFKINEDHIFEVKKIFEFYYKHNNYPNVLKRYNKPIMGLIKLLQKNRLKKRKDISISINKGDSKHMSIIPYTNSLHSNQKSMNTPRKGSLMKKSSFKNSEKSF